MKKIIKRKLNQKLFAKLKILINSNNRNKNFFFYPNLNPNNIEEKNKAMSNKLSKILKESNCFSRKENEAISTQIWATHIVNIFSKFGLKIDANELNHSLISTTNQLYLIIEDKGLLNNEKEELFNEEMDEVLFEHFLSKKLSDFKVKKNKRAKNKKKKWKKFYY